MTYQGIIFDFNGVLWRDSQLQEQAWREFARKQFGIGLTDEIMAKEVHGRNNKHTLEFLAGISLDNHQVDQLSGQKEALYRSLCLAQGDGFRLSPGAVELLDGLRANGIPCTIATASGQDNLLFFFDHLQLERWFEPQRIIFDDGIRPGKPSPDFYLQAAKKLRLQPVDCVVIEDSISGIQSARSAGIGYIIAMVSEGSNLDSNSNKGIDQVVENLAQIPWNDLFSDTGRE